MARASGVVHLWFSMSRASEVPRVRPLPKRQASVPSRSPSRPRKQPSQSRSHDTVEVILAATRQLIIKHGVERVSTNMVVRAAGVSIGSLYQYFPGKRALIAELRRRHQEQGERLIIQHALEVADAPVAVALRRLVEQMIAVHRVDPELHRALELEGREPGVSSAERRMLFAIESYMTRHKGEICVQDLPSAAYMVGRTIETLTHCAVLERPALLEDPSWVDDMIRMLLAYVTGKVA
ncbi:MAG: Transcriptional regulator, TetR family [Myxococcaceae bacterium]|nr:Transcriptional regulator, TetR family [Myxococcaceae bacterium]